MPRVPSLLPATTFEALSSEMPVPAVRKSIVLPVIEEDPPWARMPKRLPEPRLEPVESVPMKFPETTVELVADRAQGMQRAHAAGLGGAAA